VIHHFNRRIIEAYDISKDPAETRSLDANRGFAPAMIADMAEALNTRWPVYQGRIARSGVNALAMDAETRERLRSLGYIQ
jgi:hypothetical protein